jgi:hypothetical protein
LFGEWLTDKVGGYAWLKRRISREEIDLDPYAVWNAFVDFLACSKYKELTEVQQAAHLAFGYEGDVQNGGHLQFFENPRPELIGPTINALRTVDAEIYLPIFLEAVRRWRSRPRERLETVEAFVLAGRTREFEDLDIAYYEAQPPMTQVLEKYLRLKQNDFVILET